MTDQGAAPKGAGLTAIEMEMARQAADAANSFAAMRDRADALAVAIRSTGRLLLLGMGASHAAGRIVEPFYRRLGIDAVAIPLSEQLTAPLPLGDKIVIATSQSGESAELIRWLEVAGKRDGVYGMTLDPHSTLARAALSVVGSGGAEVAFAATRSLLVTLALHVAILAGLGEDPTAALQALRSPAEPDIREALECLAAVDVVVASGRQLQGLAEAVALGITELSRIPAFALEGGQFRHGPPEMLGPKVGVVLLRNSEAGASLVASSARCGGSRISGRDFRRFGRPLRSRHSQSPLAAVDGSCSRPYHATDRSAPHAGFCHVTGGGRGRTATQLEGYEDRVSPMRALAVVGNVNIDLIIGPVKPWPTPGTELMVEYDEMRAGGAAGNVAQAWRALNAPFQIAANVGNDQFGRFLKETFAGVSKLWPVADAKTTISLGLTHPDGERTFLTTKGHLPVLALEDALSCIDGERLRGGVMLLCGSFVLPRLVEAYDDLFSWTRKHEVDVALDTGWPPGGWRKETIVRAQGWLANCRHLLLNEGEAASLTGKSNPEEAARVLIGLMPERHSAVVVKRGSLGAIGRSSQGEIVNVSAMEIVVTDTIGAGDVFNAGYLLAVASGKGIAEAVRSGVETASAAISTVPRTYAGVDRRSEQLR
jgi:sugar/nucleoside kinase (ribokinase family)/fructoselysine-6-P-deglycase FrlB-like protein